MSSLPSTDDIKISAGVSSRGFFNKRCCCLAAAALGLTAIVIGLAVGLPKKSANIVESSTSGALAQGSYQGGSQGNSSLPEIILTSTAFADGQPIPSKYTNDGEDLSPALSWSQVPDGTKSLVIVMHNPDAVGQSFTHWVLFNIPPSMRKIDEGIPPGDTDVDGFVLQGVNSWKKVGYNGPYPQRGTGVHKYIFTIYAVNGVIKELDAIDATRFNVIDQIEIEGFEIIGEGNLIGTYWRD